MSSNHSNPLQSKLVVSLTSHVLTYKTACERQLFHQGMRLIELVILRIWKIKCLILLVPSKVKVEGNAEKHGKSILC